MSDVHSRLTAALAGHYRTPDHGGGPRWREPVTAGELKLAVKRILGLE